MTNFITGITTNATVDVMMTSSSTSSSTATATTTTDSISLVIGYVAALVSAVFFGSNYLPVKKFQSGNGIFFQWVLCSGIWTTGVVCFAIRGFPAYRPLSMIGGWLWCTGNLLAVPIINSIGMGKGLLVWASVSLLTGWATSRFGWFGVNAQVPNNVGMNYAGVLLCLISACFYLFLRTSGVDRKDERESGVTSEVSTAKDDTLLRRFGGRSLILKMLGTLMAVVAGLFYGQFITPIIILKDHNPDYSQNELDYIFPHFTGIFISSTAYFLIYCVITRNNPIINPNIILPGFVSGLMWGTACIAFFLANNSLSESIAFPIITTLPGVIASIWGLFLREIKGWKNYLILSIAISIGVTGSILTGLSK